MNVYAELRAHARAKWKRARNAAREEYNRDLAEINKLAKSLVGRPRKRPHSTRSLRASGGVDFSELYVSEAVAVVLSDSAMTLTELTLEIQRRGCRGQDDPRKVAHAIRAAMLYHRAKYKRDKAGRWSAVS
jgi:sRNA-binding protein